jgi:hypothetical protein
MPTPSKGEHESEFIPRCISILIKEGTDQEQAAAICYSKWNEKESFADENKVSFDYDDTLTTDKGKELAKRKIEEGKTVYIISARHSVSNMLSTAKELGIPLSRIYATGSNKAKVEKVLSLNIGTHYDNNTDVVNQLKGIGKLI